MRIGWMLALGLSACAGNTDDCNRQKSDIKDAILQAWEADNAMDRNAAWSAEPNVAPCVMNADAKAAVAKARGDGGQDRVRTYEQLCAEFSKNCSEG